MTYSDSDNAVETAKPVATMAGRYKLLVKEITATSTRMTRQALAKARRMGLGLDLIDFIPTPG